MKSLGENQINKISQRLPKSIQRHQNRVGIILGDMTVYIPEKISDIYGMSAGKLVNAFRKGGWHHDIGKAIYGSEYFRSHSDEHSETTVQALNQHPIWTEKYLLELADTLFDSQTEKQIIIDMGKYHHERYDGGGFPHGLKKDEIPFSAQLCAIVDFFDNLIMNSRNVEGRRMNFGPAYETTITNIGCYGDDALRCFIASKESLRSYYAEKRL